MYTYYGLTTYKRFPQWFRLVITRLVHHHDPFFLPLSPFVLHQTQRRSLLLHARSLQLAQMVLGTAINVHNLVVCPLDYPRYLTFGLLMYFSYLVLFAHLFYVNYCKPRQPRPASSAAKQNAAGDAEKKGTKASGKGTAPAPAPATNKKNN